MYYQKTKKIGENGDVFKSAMNNLLRQIDDVEKRYSTKIYIDSHCDLGFMDAKVYLHGDKNLINLVIIRHIRWQHEHLKPHDGYIYPYPKEEMDGE